MASAKPTRDDKFSFGLWTIGYNGTDPFGGPTRAPLDVVARRRASSPSSAPTASPSTTTTCSPSARPTPSARSRSTASSRRLADTGLIVPMVTTNLFSAPVFKDGGFTSNDRAVRRFALRKVLRNLDLAAELGAKTFVMWGGREGAEYDAAKDIRAALERYREAVNLLGDYVTDKGYDIRFAIEPKPNEPRGDILLPTVGHALAFIDTLERPELVGVNPEVGHEQMAGPELRRRHRAGAVPGQALPHRPQRPARHQVRPGPGVRPRRPAQRVRARRPARERRPRRRPGLRRPAPLRLQAVAAPRTMTGVWDSAAANMRTYLLLKERAAGVPRRPRGAGGARGVAASPSCRRRPSARASRYDDLLADRSAYEDFDAERVLRRQGLRLRAPAAARDRAPARRPLTVTCDAAAVH